MFTISYRMQTFETQRRAVSAAAAVADVSELKAAGAEITGIRDSRGQPIDLEALQTAAKSAGKGRS